MKNYLKPQICEELNVVLQSIVALSAYEEEGNGSENLGRRRHHTPDEAEDIEAQETNFWEDGIW
jgi:hypothetical protein